MSEQTAASQTARKINILHRKARATAYTPEQASEYDQRRFVPISGRKIHESEFQQLRRALRYVKAGAPILEIGCGTGRLLVQLREAGYQVDGVDASGAMLDELNKKLPNHGAGSDLMLAEAARVPKPDQSYNLVYAIRLLNQTESEEYALSVVEEMIRLTKPGGYVFVEFVNHFRPRWGAARKSTNRLKPGRVTSHAMQLGTQRVYIAGCFLLSMQAYHFVPRILLRPVAMLDRVLSRLLPRLCSRCYLMLKVGATS